MINFYHRFLPSIAAVLAPLHGLVASLKKAKDEIAWTEDAVVAFEASRSKLMQPRTLSHPKAGAELTLSLIHIPSPRDLSTSRMPSSA